MEYFDFHHHSQRKSGIYNLNISQEPVPRAFSAGLLPQYFLNINEDYFQKLADAAQDKNCVAIGECGLDSRWKTDGKSQEKIFQKHIELAESVGKPLIIHCVKKFPELLAIKKKTSAKMALHGFNKKKETADALLENGFYLSFGTALLQNVSLQKIFAASPPDRLFLETDADEDADVSEVYALAARLKSTTGEKLQEIILGNLENFRK